MLPCDTTWLQEDVVVLMWLEIWSNLETAKTFQTAFLQFYDDFVHTVHCSWTFHRNVGFVWMNLKTHDWRKSEKPGFKYQNIPNEKYFYRLYKASFIEQCTSLQDEIVASGHKHFCPKFWGKNKDVHYTRVVLILCLYVFNYFIYAYAWKHNSRKQ